jgi:hypothetical protein
VSDEEKGARITEMDATDLIGRLIINPNGVEFGVTHLAFNARSASVWIGIAEVDEETGLPGEAEAELMDLKGWTIHQKLTRREGP